MRKLPLWVLASFVLGVGTGVFLARWSAPEPVVPNSSPGPAAAVRAETGGVLPRLPRRGGRTGDRGTPLEGEPGAWLEAWVRAGAPQDHGDEALARVEQWAGTDPRAAHDFVFNAARFPRRLQAYVITLAGLCQQDATATLQWMRANLTLEERERIGAEIVRRVGEQNLVLALDVALAPGLPVDRGTFSHLLVALVAVQPERALGYFSQLSEEGRLQTAEPLVRAWFGVNREAALAWCVEQRSLPLGGAARRGLILAAAQQAPEQLPGILGRLALAPEELLNERLPLYQPEIALALLPYLPANQRRQAVETILRDELPRDPEAALRLARESLPPETSDEVLREAWNDWQHSDAKAAQAWAGTLADPGLRQRLQGQQLDPLLLSDPAAYLLQSAQAGFQNRPPAQLNRALADVANVDPAAAAAWIDRMPGLVTDEMIGEVASGFLERDEAAGWNWINALPPGSPRDTGLRRAVGYWLGHGQPANATAAVAAVADPRIQTQLRWQIVQTLYTRNEAEARRWLASQPVEPVVQETWLTMLMNSR